MARNKSNNRAFVLAALALEEAAKVVFLTFISHSSRHEMPDKALENFWHRFRDHNLKTDLALMDAWKQVLYVRRRKHVQQKHARRAFKRGIGAYTVLYRYLEQSGVRGIPDLKMRALYVDFKGRAFSGPVKIPLIVVRALLGIAASAVVDARRLRDTYRRSDVDDLAEEIWAIAFKRQMIKRFIAEPLLPNESPSEIEIPPADAPKVTAVELPQ